MILHAQDRDFGGTPAAVQALTGAPARLGLPWGEPGAP